VHNVGEKVELSAQLHVESLQLTGTAVVGSSKDALDADAVPGDGASNILEGSAHQLVHFTEEKGFKVDWDSSGLKNLIVSLTFLIFKCACYLENLSD